MKKRNVLIIVVILLSLLEIGLYRFVRYKDVYNSLFITFNDVHEVEYGSEVNAEDFVKDSYGDISYPEFNSNEIGLYKLVYIVSDNNVSREFDLEVEVIDRTAPIIKLKNNKVETEYGNKINIESYIESISDNLDGKLEYCKDSTGYYYKDDIDYNKAGTYKVEITAYDSNGNKSSKELQVIVKEKEVVEESQETLQQNVQHKDKRIIVINAGHQKEGNNQKEQIGPDSSDYKAKVSYGATGTYTKIRESETVLDIAKQLKKELESKGYIVYMTRTSQDVNISNKERAILANNKKADAVISLHCDSSDNKNVTGAHTISIARDNKYCPGLYNEGKILAESIISEYCKTTGIKNRGVSYRNDLTTLNWSEVPSVMLEMGFVSNKEEDILLNTSSFQKKIVRGIVNGMDLYFSK